MKVVLRVVSGPRVVTTGFVTGSTDAVTGLLVVVRIASVVVGTSVIGTVTVVIIDSVTVEGTEVVLTVVLGVVIIVVTVVIIVEDGVVPLG